MWYRRIVPSIWNLPELHPGTMDKHFGYSLFKKVFRYTSVAVGSEESFFNQNVLDDDAYGSV